MNTKHKFETAVIVGCFFACLILLIINIFMSSPSSKAGSSMDAPLPSLQTAEGCCQHFYKARVTAYCPCEICTGKWSDGITASGKPAEGFFVAADPEIPFGTLLSIPGYNDGLPVPVLDRGRAIQGNKLDVFFSTHQEALNWGVQNLEVKISGE